MEAQRDRRWAPAFGPLAARARHARAGSRSARRRAKPPLALHLPRGARREGNGRPRPPLADRDRPCGKRAGDARSGSRDRAPREAPAPARRRRRPPRAASRASPAKDAATRPRSARRAPELDGEPRGSLGPRIPRGFGPTSRTWARRRGPRGARCRSETIRAPPARGRAPRVSPERARSVDHRLVGCTARQKRASLAHRALREPKRAARRGRSGRRVPASCRRAPPYRLLPQEDAARSGGRAVLAPRTSSAPNVAARESRPVLRRRRIQQL